MWQATYIDDTDHAGFQLPGWKSLIDVQMRVSGWNRPLGVCTLIPLY